MSDGDLEEIRQWVLSERAGNAHLERLGHCPTTAFAVEQIDGLLTEVERLKRIEACARAALVLELKDGWRIMDNRAATAFHALQESLK